MSTPLPETLDELCLILENDSAFYDTVSRRVKDFADGHVGALGLRATVFSATRSVIRGYGARHQATTSYLVRYFVERYAPDPESAVRRLGGAYKMSPVLYRQTFWEEQNIRVRTEVRDPGRVPTNTADSPTSNTHLEATTTPKEIDMTAPLIETRVFICNNPAKDVSDDTIFNIIKTTEADIAKLEAIANRPKKLQAKIDSMKAEIDALVKFVDERE